MKKKPTYPMTREEVRVWCAENYPKSAYEINAIESLGKPRWQVHIVTPHPSGNPWQGSATTIESFDRKAGEK